MNIPIQTAKAAVVQSVYKLNVSNPSVDSNLPNVISGL